ncbi:hypothetical protein [Roseovarius aestuariivivens]|uniref:hypothetical protein n=1 Tax=Roseovarius aestuariivivens TaxID=1888910 RepID=UPI00107FD5C0|nr:hypothetical protein [Roseovarius aestuariivivens]
MRKTTHRNAMIKTEARHWSDPEELDAALREAFAPKKQSLEERFDYIEAIFASFLNEKGCPHPIEFCMFLGAHWCALPTGFDKMSDAEMRLAMKSATVGRGSAYIKQNFKLTDQEAIAADICLRIFGYPRLSAEQKPEAAFHIGRLSQLLSSLGHLKMVERGKSNRESTSRGGKNSEKTDEIKTSLAVMSKYRKRHSENRSAQLAARDLGLKHSTMLSRWNRAKKKGETL